MSVVLNRTGRKYREKPDASMEKVMSIASDRKDGDELVQGMRLIMGLENDIRMVVIPICNHAFNDMKSTDPMKIARTFDGEFYSWELTVWANGHTKGCNLSCKANKDSDKPCLKYPSGDDIDFGDLSLHQLKQIRQDLGVLVAGTLKAFPALTSEWSRFFEASKAT